MNTYQDLLTLIEAHMQIQIDKELQDIIIKAIPAESCPVKNANAMHRREVLKTRIIAYLQKQLSNQFNARSFKDSGES